MLKLVRVLMSQKLLMNLLVFLVFIIGYRTYPFKPRIFPGSQFRYGFDYHDLSGWLAG